MCEYVSKEELKEPKRIIDCWIRKVQQKLKAETHIHFSYNPIGSGKRNMVVRQCNKQTFDLDYQIVLTRLPKEIEQNFSKNAKFIKDLFRKTFDEFKPNGFSSFEDSTQALTTFNKKERFGYDIIITKLDENGNSFILYNKKNTNGANNNDYCWEQKKDLSIYRQRLKRIKGAEMWNELRRIYLEKKCKYKNQQEPNKKKSYQILNEAVVETINNF